MITSEHTSIHTKIFWLKDESIEDLENLPAPDTLAREIANNLESAFDQFNSIYEDLESKKS